MDALLRADQGHRHHTAPVEVRLPRPDGAGSERVRTTAGRLLFFDRINRARSPTTSAKVASPI
jgi:hypothetical protein